jgi:hypothetical protein
MLDSNKDPKTGFFLKKEASQRSVFQQKFIETSTK